MTVISFIIYPSIMHTFKVHKYNFLHYFQMYNGTPLIVKKEILLGLGERTSNVMFYVQEQR